MNKKRSTFIKKFLGFLPTKRWSSQQLFGVLPRLQDNLELSFTSMRSHGFCSGSNMKGEHMRIFKQRLKSSTLVLFFIPCGSHSLNLVVNYEAYSSLEGTNFFNDVQKVYIDFFCHPLSDVFFFKHVKKSYLKTT